MKPVTLGLITLAAALVLTGCSVEVHSSAFGSGCRYSEDRSATVALDGATRLAVTAGAGDLRIEGKPDLTEVRISGRACAADADLISRVQVRTGKSGDTLRVETEIPTVVGNSPTLDLTLEVPQSMLVNVRDASGDMRVASVAAADIRDESGSIDLQDIAGEVRVDDQSGDIEIRGAGSVASLLDQSGEIRISDVANNVLIERDESGSIIVTHVGGKVTIDEDQSGDIDVQDVKQDFTVGHDGSGSIHYDRISGRVSVPDKH